MTGAVKLANGIVRFPPSLQTDFFCYVLPTASIETGREVICTNMQDAKQAGIWALGMMGTKGVEKLIFNTHQGRDCVWIKYSDVTKRPAVEGVLQRFAANVGPDGTVKNPKLALLNKLNGFTEAAFVAETEKLKSLHPNEPWIAGAKALIHVFNECVARPDGGEVVFKRYLVEGNQGVVEVEMKAACASCAAQSLSVAGQLNGLFIRHMPNAVQKVRIG